MTFNRRGFLQASAAGLAAASATPVWSVVANAADGELGPAALPAGALQAAALEALPGKVALIKKTYRPPNFETPVRYFDQPFTSNDAFFVRYHLAGIPQVDAATWRLSIGGEAVEKPFELTLDQLKREFQAVEVAAVCQCSGNRRG